MYVQNGSSCLDVISNKDLDRAYIRFRTRSHAIATYCVQNGLGMETQERTMPKIKRRMRNWERHMGVKLYTRGESDSCKATLQTVEYKASILQRAPYLFNFTLCVVFSEQLLSINCVRLISWKQVPRCSLHPPDKNRRRKSARRSGGMPTLCLSLARGPRRAEPAAAAGARLPAVTLI